MSAKRCFCNRAYKSRDHSLAHIRACGTGARLDVVSTSSLRKASDAAPRPRSLLVLTLFWAVEYALGKMCNFLGLNRNIHSSNLSWKWRGAPYKTTILYIEPSMSFRVNLGEGNRRQEAKKVKKTCTFQQADTLPGSQAWKDTPSYSLSHNEAQIRLH